MFISKKPYQVRNTYLAAFDRRCRSYDDNSADQPYPLSRAYSSRFPLLLIVAMGDRSHCLENADEHRSASRCLTDRGCCSPSKPISENVR